MNQQQQAKKVKNTDTDTVTLPYKSVYDKIGLLGCLGLFVPVPTSNTDSCFPNSKYGWNFTITIGKIPLGWPMILVAILFS